MVKNNITFVIFTYNEENRISYPIRNFINYGEVIIIDNFSDDKTMEVAENLGAKVYQFKNKGFVETQEELDFVRSRVETEYMTRTMSDHMRDKKLLQETIKITNQGVYDGIACFSKNYHYGLEKLNFERYNSQWNHGFKIISVYKKQFLYCKGIIHGNLRNNCKSIYYVPRKKGYFIHHLSTYNVKKFELGHSKYSDIESKMRFDAGIKTSLFKALFKCFAFFFLYYLIEGGWKSGKAGFIMVMQYVFFYFNVWAKQRELENNITLESIEDNYNIIRNNILKEFTS